MTDRNNKNGPSPRLKERLEFIEQRLFWEGCINRNDLTSHFGISKPQATLDLKEYQELAPNNLQYDINAKRYTPAKTFEPQFGSPSAEDYLQLLYDARKNGSTTALGFTPETELMTSFQRPVRPEILQGILSAFKQKARIQIVYHAPTRANSTLRWINPLVMVYTLNRWHVRAYCHWRGQFRSFVLGRILGIKSRANETQEVPPDKHWHTNAAVTIVPSPRLLGGAPRIIEQDYGMNGGEVTLNIRLALLEYFLLENALLESCLAEPDGRAPIRPDNGQVAIQNLEEVSAALVESRRDRT